MSVEILNNYKVIIETTIVTWILPHLTSLKTHRIDNEMLSKFSSCHTRPHSFIPICIIWFMFAIKKARIIYSIKMCETTFPTQFYALLSHWYLNFPITITALIIITYARNHVNIADSWRNELLITSQNYCRK
jgi:hypothetical protein